MIECHMQKKILKILIISVLSIICLGRDLKLTNVLIINSYHPQYKWTQELTDSIKHRLELEIPEENIFIEYLDGRRFSSDQDYLNELITFFTFKFKKRFHPNLIIANDDYAFQFLLKHGEEIFGNTPIVFGGVNIFEASFLNGKTNITGIREGHDLEKNISLISKIHPNLDKLYILSDEATIGSELTKEAISVLGKTDIQYFILNNLTYQNLQEKLAKASKRSVALLLSIQSDIEGRYFSYATDLRELSNKSNIPIYGMWGMNNGLGTIGGYMTDAYTHGQEISNVAVEILKGARVSAFSVIPKTKFMPQFDYFELKRFDIDLSLLPKESLVKNLPESFYGKYKYYIYGIIALFFSLVIIILFLKRAVNLKTKHLANLNETLREFVGIVAHDLRNPIGSIVNLSDLLLRSDIDPKQIIPVIKSSAENSLQLVNDILELSAIESGKITIKQARMSFQKINEMLSVSLGPLANKKGITLLSNLNTDEILVNADENRIYQVLENLVSNAIKFSKPDGVIKVSTQVTEKKITVSVEDNGIGIPSSMIEKLFSKNSHSSRKGTAGEEGTGYGLPLAFEIVKLHNSELKCASIEGQGTIFTFDLDLV